MKRVLFVDDEPNVLHSMKRALRRMRNEWEMAFAKSGPQALEELARQPFDVIVTDMRMPGMDGVELLAEVRERYPGTLRIILSGHADKEMIIDATRVAQQYLAKPCETDVLRETVERSCALSDLLSQEPVVRLVSHIDALPSLPDRYLELMEELRAPEPSVQNVGEIISRDIAMTAKVLHLANSAFFGLSRRISSPERAATLLGLDLIGSLAVVSWVFSAFEGGDRNLDVEALWSHGMLAGQLARRIAERETKERSVVDQSFTAGMLHDVGKLVLASRLPADYARSQKLAREQSTADWEAEAAIIGCDHAQIGAYLLGSWGIEHPVVEAVAFHHQPGRAGSSVFTPLTAVHVADAFLERVDSAGTGRVDEDYLQRLGLAERLASWFEMLEGEDRAA